MTVHLTKFNMMDHLNSEEDCRLALQAAYEEDPGDGSLIEKGRENRVALAARMKRPRLNDKVSQVAEH